jgi:hypothetical protein
VFTLRTSLIGALFSTAVEFTCLVAVQSDAPNALQNSAMVLVHVLLE